MLLHFVDNIKGVENPTKKVSMIGMLKVYIDTNGCEEAKLDAQRLKNLVCGTSYVCTNDARTADIVVFLACGHLQANENESIRKIKRLISLKKSSCMLVVGGCLPEINPEAVRRIHKGCMIGPDHWDFFCDVFNQSKEKITDVHANELCITSKSANPSLRLPFRGLNTLLDELARPKSKKTWYIKIVNGCKENCTYCSDRLAFKQCKSEPIDTIISQFELGLKSGFKDFYLVGRDLGSYGFDVGSDLPTLLNRMLENHRAKNYELQLYNVSPGALVDFYPKLKEVFSSGKISLVGSHIQSGSDRILGLMGRPYSIYEWLKTVKEIKEKYPGIHFSTSIIVGFPTETEQDFEKSMELLDFALFDKVDLYMYEGRPNLPSLRLGGQIPERVKEMRSDLMRHKLILHDITKNAKRMEIGLLAKNLISYANLLADKS